MRIVGISVDPDSASAKLKSDLHLGFPLLSDRDGQVSRRYGLLHPKGHADSDIARPAELLLDREGVIRWAMFTDNVRVRARPELVLEAAKRLHER